MYKGIDFLDFFTNLHVSCLVYSVGNQSGGVYDYIWSLINKGKDAHLVNQEGRYALNWPVAVDRYFEFQKLKSRKKSKKFDRKSAGNGLRAALLNFYGKEGAHEFKEARKFNDKNEVIEREFQMPPAVFSALRQKSGGVTKEDVVSSDESNFEVMLLKSKCVYFLLYALKAGLHVRHKHLSITASISIYKDVHM